MYSSPRSKTKMAKEYVNCMSKCDINFSYPLWISRAGGIFVYIQKPLSIGHSLIQAQLLRVTRFSLLKTLQSVLWFYGLSLCGPFRTILITQHYDFAVITGVGALFSGRYSASNILVTALCDITFDHNFIYQTESVYNNSNICWKIE